MCIRDRYMGSRFFMNNIKYFAYIRLADNLLLYGKSAERRNEGTFRNEALLMAARIKGMNLFAEERQRQNSANGCWSFTVDRSQIAYLVLSTATYSERLSFALLKEAREHLETLDQYFVASDAVVTRHCKEFVKRLMEKFDKPESFDQLTKAHANIRELEVIAEKNISKVLVNTQNLGDLQTKTEKMRNNAADFRSNAAELNRIMYWRNMRLNIIIGSMVLGGLGYAYLILIK
eukprot:TRINITY_DN12824_c0_g1_i1.p1 TRINITY_DN12824_c0_g1~~TRINITY_DN12824_c0_g1_i1.p1  ORF type:complete len:253 (+),score=70.08 TRINITY_DN12824_c0_g1_i1:62-760(+)